MELWELVARERIRDTLAAYNWSGDALRLREMAATFHPDGVIHVRGEEPLRGREAIAAFMGGVAAETKSTPAAPRTGGRRIVRHLLTNVRFLEVAPGRALVDAYFTVVTEIGLDHHGRYRDTLEPAGDDWLIRHRKVSTDWWAPDTTMPPRV